MDICLRITTFQLVIAFFCNLLLDFKGGFHLLLSRSIIIPHHLKQVLAIALIGCNDCLLALVRMRIVFWCEAYTSLINPESVFIRILSIQSETERKRQCIVTIGR